MGRARPKVFVGYSDATALHEAIATRLGVATLFGPMVAAEVFGTDADTQAHLRATLFEPESVRSLGSPAAHTLAPGRAAGVTVGGCLTLVTTDLGTPAGRTTFAGGVLALEDVGLDPYELDRGFTQLARAGVLAAGEQTYCYRDGCLTLDVSGVRVVGVGRRPTRLERIGGPLVRDEDPCVVPSNSGSTGGVGE